MKMKLNITKLRGTIFTKYIKYSPEFVKELSEVLSGYIPSFVTTMPGNYNNDVIPNLWEMVDPVKGERVQFNSIKVDIILNCRQQYNDGIISDFAKHCSDIFCKILSITGQTSSRLAIAPTFVCVDSDANIKVFAKEVFSKNTFKGSVIDNCVFNNIFRVDEEICGNSVLVNYLANFYSINQVTDVDNRSILRETLAIDFDVNTSVNRAYEFDNEAIKSFFSKSPNMCLDYLNFFFE